MSKIEWRTASKRGNQIDNLLLWILVPVLIVAFINAQQSAGSQPTTPAPTTTAPAQPGH